MSERKRNPHNDEITLETWGLLEDEIARQREAGRDPITALSLARFILTILGINRLMEVLRNLIVKK